ncbi:U1 small nuclear ribonucleoprotein C [Mucuna pruriens]|uniref:U1 small nuclear ribonucleoprotein C n=1 Tax=Mucuna pruriens TaxID=157652 RepID=A0A371GK83_MUCPR|nr:U1 small nuclear ribonucleoprotein C [Mucuna pruriens]
MPRYYCDYCDTYLTHDSFVSHTGHHYVANFAYMILQPSVRKQHNAGYKHKANVRTYYQQFEEQQTQSLIDQRIKEHLGQAAAFQQVGVAYNHLMVQRPTLPPVLPPPRLPIPGTAQVPGGQPLMLGMRPPVFPRPGPGAPGYTSAPTMPSMLPPPGAPQIPGQLNTIPRPPSLAPPPTAPGSTSTPASNGAPSMVSSAMYQANPPAPPPAVLKHLRAITDLVELFSMHNFISIRVLWLQLFFALPTSCSSNEDSPSVVIYRVIIGM